jgi:hypothetical protein
MFSDSYPSEDGAMEDRRMNTNRSLEKRLAAYGSMSLALAAVSMPAAARAGSIEWAADVTTTVNTPLYFDLQSGNVGGTGFLNSFELMTRQEGTALAAFLLAKGSQFNASSLNGNEFAVTASSSIAKLIPGASLVGPARNFGSLFGTLASNVQPPGVPFGQWNATPAAGDVGLSIVRGGDTYYGWADIIVNPDYTITLNAFGYDDTPGESEIAGPVPEPSSIELLALGAAGIAAYRRRRKIG